MEARALDAPVGGATARAPRWLLGLGPLLLVVAAVGAFAALGGPGLGERHGPPVEELAVQRTILRPGSIELVVRNDGPDAVSIAQVTVNDAFVPFTGADEPIGRLGSARVKIAEPWTEGQAYEVSMLTSTGATITHTIAAAAETPSADLSFFALMALLGVYVGVIPIALGMLWLPWVRRIPAGWMRAIMALTLGLLGFLAIDATLEGLDIAATGSQALGGAALVPLGAAAAFLALSAVSAWLRDRGAAGGRLALMVAIGIGLHNLGEGLAIGVSYATGALALGAFLVVGFALHNTTEGLAVVAPLASERPGWRRLALLGALAGAPAVVGAWIGGVAYSAPAAALLLGVGVGAILQVALQILPSVRERGSGRTITPLSAGGLAAGLAVMYATSLLV